MAGPVNQTVALYAGKSATGTGLGKSGYTSTTTGRFHRGLEPPLRRRQGCWNTGGVSRVICIAISGHRA